jgi:hypothetical protein
MCGYLTQEDLDAEDALANEKEREAEKAKQGRASGSRGNRN